jgi:L-threonylcarbamoyladenylate synthase
MARPRVLRWSEAEPGRAAEAAAAALRAGGVVAHPTETVYGLAVSAADERAHAALLRLKGGGAPRAFLLLFADRQALRESLGELPPGGERLADAFWPGPLTLLVPAGAGLPAWWSGPEGDVAARVTPHPFCRALLAALGGPVLSTSANRPGEPPLETAAAVTAAFSPDELALVVDGGRLRGSPSTLLRWTDRGWSVVRPGPVSREALARAVGTGGPDGIHA